MKLSKTILLFVLILYGYHIHGQTPLADSLQQVIAKHPRDTIGIKALVNLTSEIARHDPPSVKKYAFQALNLARALKTNLGISGSYTHLTNYYSNMGMPDSARYYLNQMKILSEKFPDDKEICGNYYLAAGLFYKNKGEFDTALPLMIKALDCMTTAKFKINRAGQLLNIGNTYLVQGDLKNAAKYHMNALKSFEALDNKRGQSFCLQSLGNDYYKLNYFADAKKYFEKSLALKVVLNDRRGMITTWSGLGGVHTELGEYKLALQYYQKALKQARELSLTQNELNSLHEMGLLYLKMGKSNRAKSIFLEALPLAQQRGDSLMSANFGARLAALQQDSLKILELEKNLLHKAKAARMAGDKYAETEAYLKLAEWHAERKDYQQAFDFQKKHYQFNDSLKGENVLVQLKQLEEQYQDENNLKEIMLLKKDKELNEAKIAEQTANQTVIIILFVSFLLIVVLLIKYYSTVNKTNRTIAIERVRNHIARDLHDDMGSALSSIHINSQLAMTDSTKTKLHLHRIAESASHMMESMSDIVWSINPENDTLEKMIIKMKEFAAEILEPKNICYNFVIGEELGKTRLSVETRKNLYLIFKESINNAAKYSEGSAVEISICLQHHKLHLSVRDNGKGFESAKVRYGNGLINMAERARNLQGKFTHQSLPGQGTEISAELPVT